MAPSLLSQLVDAVRAVVGAATSSPPSERAQRDADGRPRQGRAPRPAAPHRPASAPEDGGRRPEYAPHADGDPDPGEVVWAWVPFEEDASRGKDRPVLVVAVDGARVTALMLTSKDHDADAAEQARRGRRWMDVGTGAWDAQRRPSEVRLDRVLHLEASAVRREGAAVDRDVYERVVTAAGRLHGWD